MAAWMVAEVAPFGQDAAGVHEVGVEAELIVVVGVLRGHRAPWYEIVLLKKLVAG